MSSFRHLGLGIQTRRAVQAVVSSAAPQQKAVAKLPIYSDYVGVPTAYNQPDYHPVIYDHEWPHAGVPGHHYLPGDIPPQYALYWGKGERELPLFTVWSYGHQYSVFEMLLFYLGNMGLIFFLYLLAKEYLPTPWFMTTSMGPAILPGHDAYLARGGNPEDPLYRAQLAREKAILEEGIRIAKAAAASKP